MNASNGSLVNASYCKALFERDDSEQVTGLEWVGLLLAACSTFISTYCLLWIKRSTIVEMGFPLCPCQCCGGRYGGPWKRIFVIAMCGNIVSEALLSSTAYVFAPLSLILPVGGSALIFTGVLTRLGVVPGIKEHLSPVEWVTLGFTALAMVGTSAFGPKAESVPPFDDWQAQWQRPAVPMHYALTMLAGLVWTALVTRLSHLNPWREGTTVYAILSALTSGALGSWAVLFTKVYSTAIQIALSTGDTRAASLWITWFAVAGFAISGPAQLFLMHKSLTGGRARCTASFALAHARPALPAPPAPPALPVPLVLACLHACVPHVPLTRVPPCACLSTPTPPTPPAPLATSTDGGMRLAASACRSTSS